MSIKLFNSLASKVLDVLGLKSETMKLLEEANELYNAKEYKRAIDVYKQTLKSLRYGKKGTVLTKERIKKFVIPAFLNMAAASVELKLYTNTAFYCEKVLALHPKHKKATYYLAMANIQTGSYNAAMNIYKRPKQRRD
jgi:tetratricopeptide (TPR) repeat protein